MFFINICVCVFFFFFFSSRYVSTSNPFSAWSAVCTEHISPAPGLTSLCPWSVSSRWQCSWRGVCCQSFWGQPSTRYWPGNLNLILLTIVWNSRLKLFHYFLHCSNLYPHLSHFHLCFNLYVHQLSLAVGYIQLFLSVIQSFCHLFNKDNSQIQYMRLAKCL